ncbi:MAG TPA: DUF4097 family beta strand repeat-containing protein [Gaiellaceae bacterium]|nr:DUF4097 family beta strand repeat-containing protein [Gaiellaceae bacterium]
MLEHTFTTPLPLTLEVAIPSGDIEVETVDGDQTHLTVDGDDELLELVEIHQDGNRVTVTMRSKSKMGFFGSIMWGKDSLRVQASVPHGADVKVKTASADSEIKGRVGRLDVNSASGDLVLRGEADDVIVKTVSGDVDVARVGGNLSVQSVSGDVRSGAVSGSVDTKSVSGDIRLEGVSAGDVRFASVSGDIEIGVASGSLLDVDAGSTSGDLSSEIPISSAPAGDGGGSPTVVLRGRTVSGDVRVFRA